MNISKQVVNLIESSDLDWLIDQIDSFAKNSETSDNTIIRFYRVSRSHFRLFIKIDSAFVERELFRHDLPINSISMILSPERNLELVGFS